MTRACWLLAAIGILGCWNRALADSGPSLGSPGDPASSEIRTETLPPGLPESVESTPRDTSPAPTADAWRYQFYQGRWWYYLPEARWVYWNGRAWAETAATAPAAFAPLPGTAGFIPNAPGVVQRRSPPPYRWLPRREGESEGRYMGRLARWNSPYANGFLQFSGPPPGYYGYGLGYGMMNPYSGYRPPW